MWSTELAFLTQSLTYCASIDDYLQTLVVSNYFLNGCCLSITMNQSTVYSSPSSDIKKPFLSTQYLSFIGPALLTLEMVGMNPSRSAISEMLKPAHPRPTTMILYHIQRYLNPSFPSLDPHSAE